MADNNLHIWQQLEHTDPEHTKPFQRTGGFRGTAIKPIYSIRKMTEVFGPCGEGWGVHEPKFEIVGDAVFCTVALWYESEGHSSYATVYGVGGDLVVKHTKDGRSYHDDEAFKKAFTDALTNSMKHIGMSADVHMGDFDGSKYVQNGPQPPQDARGGAGKGDVPARAPTRSQTPPRAQQSPPPSAEHAESRPPASTTAAGNGKRRISPAMQKQIDKATEIRNALETARPEQIMTVWRERQHEIEQFPTSWQGRLQDLRDRLLEEAPAPAETFADEMARMGGEEPLDGRSENQR